MAKAKKTEELPEETNENLSGTGEEQEQLKAKKRSKHSVVLQFRDKHDQNIYNPGDDYSPRDENRAAELIKKGVIKKKD